MKRVIVYGLLGLLLVGGLSAWWGITWLLDSTAGVTFLMRQVSERTPVKISARAVTGRFGRELSLEGVSVSWPQGDVAVDRLRIRWRLRWLLFGKLAVQDLNLGGIRIHDRTPPSGQPPDLTIPRATGIPGWLDAWIDHLSVTDLAYRSQDSPATVIPALSGALSWHYGRLSIVNLQLDTPQARTTGSLIVGFRKPSLFAALALNLTQPVAGCSRVDLHAKLSRSRSPEQLAGTVAVAAMDRNRKLLEVNGEAGIARSVIALRGMKIIHPGQRGTLTGEGKVTLTTAAPQLRLTVRGAGLDLRKETGTITDLSGVVTLSGTPEHYAGRFDLVNKGATWRSARLRGGYAGTPHEVNLSDVEGALLGGTVRGGLRLGWEGATAISWSLQGNGLNPALVTPDWSGVVNFSSTGEETWVDGKPRGEVQGVLRESRLRGRALQGEVDARNTGDNLLISRLLLSGKGFHLQAEGELRRRLSFTARITDLGGMVPGSSGALNLSGWARFAGGFLSGEARGGGRHLAVEGMRLATVDLSARLADRPEHPVEVTAAATGLQYQHLTVASATMTVQGTRDRHLLEVSLGSAGAHVSLAATGTLQDAGWQGDIIRLSGSDSVGPVHLVAPARVTISRSQILLAPLTLAGTGAERLEVGGRLFLEPFHGGCKGAWRDLNLARANQWLKGLRLTGRSSGSFTADSRTGDRLSLSATARMTGAVTTEATTITVTTAALDLDAGDRGIRAGIELRTGEGISVTGRFTSPGPAGLALPETGEIAANWQGVDLALLKHRLPPQVSLTGVLSGTAGGKLLADGRLDLTGNVALEGGAARYRYEGREVGATMKRASLSWVWRGETLGGDATLKLAERGEATARFSLPLPARLETGLEPDGPVMINLVGQLHEKGLLTALFPGLVKESRGEVAVALGADGPWKSPRFRGTVQLSGAGASLPAAGISITGVTMTARLAGERITVESFRAESGAGYLEGNAELALAGWHLESYRGMLKGKRFQMVRQPEFQLLADPDLTFSGDSRQLVVRGAVLLPQVVVNNPKKNLVTPSSDVVVVRKGAAPVKKAPPLMVDARVRVTLGDKVIVRLEGLDAQLEGFVDLTARGWNDVKGSGEIKVAKGRYSIYGVTLDIVRGRVMFAGGPVNLPTLDILALRVVDNVKAGVTVTGTPENPVVTLYSDPAMPDVDILSYVVLGKKLGSSEEKTDLLTSAASVLASSGQSVFLQEQIKERLGLDTIGVTTSGDETSGYKQVERTLGPSPTKQSVNTLSETMLQVGKYLTPQLYVSYGWSMFSDTHQVKIRYNITKQWEIETKAGTSATGGDIFYRIEFE